MAILACALEDGRDVLREGHWSGHRLSLRIGSGDPAARKSRQGDRGDRHHDRTNCRHLHAVPLRWLQNPNRSIFQAAKQNCLFFVKFQTSPVRQLRMWQDVPVFGLTIAIVALSFWPLPGAARWTSQ